MIIFECHFYQSFSTLIVSYFSDPQTTIKFVFFALCVTSGERRHVSQIVYIWNLERIWLFWNKSELPRDNFFIAFVPMLRALCIPKRNLLSFNCIAKCWLISSFRSLPSSICFCLWWFIALSSRSNTGESSLSTHFFILQAKWWQGNPLVPQQWVDQNVFDTAPLLTDVPMQVLAPCHQYEALAQKTSFVLVTFVVQE